jgi:hypothetical protein
MYNYYFLIRATQISFADYENNLPTLCFQEGCHPPPPYSDGPGPTLPNRLVTFPNSAIF